MERLPAYFVLNARCIRVLDIKATQVVATAAFNIARNSINVRATRHVCGLLFSSL